jgi:hypothetical protein
MGAINPLIIRFADNDEVKFQKKSQRDAAAPAGPLSGGPGGSGALSAEASGSAMPPAVDLGAFGRLAMAAAPAAATTQPAMMMMMPPPGAWAGGGPPAPVMVGGQAGPPMALAHAGTHFFRPASPTPTTQVREIGVSRLYYLQAGPIKLYGVSVGFGQFLLGFRGAQSCASPGPWRGGNK